MKLLTLTRSTAMAVTLAWLVTFLPGLRTIQAVDAAGAPLPLPRYTETSVLATQAPTLPCSGRTRIVQECTLGALPGIRTLEQRVIADLLAIHKLPAGASSGGDLPAGDLTIGGTVPDPGTQGNAGRLLNWERDSLRALLFDKIALIISRGPADAEERAIVDALAALVGQQRLAAATEAKRFYTLWQNNPCTFTPPAGFSYAPPQSCFIPNSLGAIFQNPPSLEQFQGYGAASAGSKFQTSADLQAAAAGAAKAYGLLGGVALAGIAAAITYTVITNAAFGAALVAAILPYALKGTALSAAFASGAAAGQTAASIGLSAGASGFAAAAFIIVIAVTIGVIAGITIFAAAETPRKLDAAITAAQTPPDLKALIATEDGKREVYGAFIATTVNSSGSGQVGVEGLELDGWAPVPAAQTDDQKFVLNPGPSEQLSAELVFKGWDRTGRARMSQGWLVNQAVANAPALTLDLDYLNHAGEQWTAWRIGDQFLHTTAGNVKPSFLSDLIQYQDAAGVNRTAKIQAPDRTPPSANPVLSSPANAAGWHNAPVTVTWNWSDNPGGEGLDTATCPPSSAVATGTTVFVTCKDLAGNQGSGSASVKIDTQAPAFSGPPALSPPPNAAGWNNADVTVTFVCNDGDLPGVIIFDGTLSGVASCGPNRTLTSEGRNQSVTGTATDVAGNSATQQAEGINIDKTAPAVTQNSAADSCSQPGANGWCQGTQTAGFQASDALSGLATAAQASFTQTSATEGAAVMIASGAVSDIAGNTNAGISAGPFKIDKTAPAFASSPANQTVNATSPAGAAVTFATTATDNLDAAPTVSCSHPSGSTFANGTTTVTCTATDQAGNTATVSFTVTVRDATVQLTALKTTVTGVGPGTSLADKVQAAQTALQAGNRATACGELRDFLNQVRAQDGRQLTAAQAQQFTADATRIRTVLACA